MKFSFQKNQLRNGKQDQLEQNLKVFAGEEREKVKLSEVIRNLWNKKEKSQSNRV